MNFCVLTAQNDGADLNPGDEVGIFDGNICVGAGIFSEVLVFGVNYLSIVVSKDDTDTPEIEGYTPDNTASFKLWDKDNNTEITDVTANYASGDRFFAQGASSSVHLSGKTTFAQFV
jgi:hypothetical protein